MPNWCFNKLTLSGDKAEIQKFQKYVIGVEDSDFESKGDILSFNRIRPITEIVSWTDGGKDKTGWIGLETCTNIWGTKWPARDTRIVKEMRTLIQYEFNTVWTPPLGVFEALVKSFPHITEVVLEYTEGDMCFAGQIVAKNGEIISSDQWIYYTTLADIYGGYCSECGEEADGFEDGTPYCSKCAQNS